MATSSDDPTSYQPHFLLYAREDVVCVTNTLHPQGSGLSAILAAVSYRLDLLDLHKTSHGLRHKTPRVGATGSRWQRFKPSSCTNTGFFLCKYYYCGVTASCFYSRTDLMRNAATVSYCVFMLLFNWGFIGMTVNHIQLGCPRGRLFTCNNKQVTNFQWTQRLMSVLTDRTSDSGEEQVNLQHRNIIDQPRV